MCQIRCNFLPRCSGRVDFLLFFQVLGLQEIYNLSCFSSYPTVSLFGWCSKEIFPQTWEGTFRTAKTNSWSLKMDAWKTILSFWLSEFRPIFRGEHWKTLGSSDDIGGPASETSHRGPKWHLPNLHLSRHARLWVWLYMKHVPRYLSAWWNMKPEMENKHDIYWS